MFVKNAGQIIILNVIRYRVGMNIVSIASIAAECWSINGGEYGIS